MAKKTTKTEPKNVVVSEEVVDQVAEVETVGEVTEEITPNFPDDDNIVTEDAVEPNKDYVYPVLEEEFSGITAEEPVVVPPVVTPVATENIDINKNITIPVEIWRDLVLIFKGYRNVKEIITIANNSDNLRIVVTTQALVDQLKKIVPESVAAIIYSK